MHSLGSFFRSRRLETDRAATAGRAQRGRRPGRQRSALWLGFAVAIAFAINLLLSFTVQLG